MNQFVSRRSFFVVSGVAALGVSGIGGCSALTVAPGSPADIEVLMSRAKAYWAFSQANDNVSAWPFENVSLDPKWTLQGYLQRGGAAYDAVVIKGVSTVEGDKAELDIDITFSLPAIKIYRHKMAIKDPWRRIEGQWYHVLQPDSIFRQS